jgi:hypothetical protein
MGGRTFRYHSQQTAWDGGTGDSHEEYRSRNDLDGERNSELGSVGEVLTTVADPISSV